MITNANTAPIVLHKSHGEANLKANILKVFSQLMHTLCLFKQLIKPSSLQHSMEFNHRMQNSIFTTHCDQSACQFLVDGES